MVTILINVIAGEEKSNSEVKATLRLLMVDDQPVEQKVKQISLSDD